MAKETKAVPTFWKTFPFEAEISRCELFGPITETGDVSQELCQGVQQARYPKPAGQAWSKFRKLLKQQHRENSQDDGKQGLHGGLGAGGSGLRGATGRGHGNDALHAVII